jgi:ABC-type dipeptide/oligopeptide/nickel transport system ATPase component
MATPISIMHTAHLRCPPALRQLQGWLVWRFEPNANPGGKPRKVPYYVSGQRRAGQHGRPEDRHQLVTFAAARAAAARLRFDGVGFAPMADFGIVALDFDNCVADTGEIHPDVLAALSTTYAEFSPSGHGIRAFFVGQLGNLKSHGAPFGMETFSTNGFVTFTGNALPFVDALGNLDTVAPVDEEVLALVTQRFKRELSAGSVDNSDTPPLGLPTSTIEHALASLPADLDYDTWLNVGMALHHETNGDGFETWDAWSQLSPKYTSRSYGLERWNSFGKRASGPVVTARSLVHLANDHGAGIELNGPASASDFDAIADTLEAQPDTDDYPVVDAQPSPKEKPPRFTPISVEQFAARPPPQWIIKNVLPKAELVVLYGESGSGKSFLALQMAAAIARGLPWRGHRVRQGRVVYIAAEGAGGFRNRCVAYAQAEGMSLADLPLDIVADAPNLLLKEDALAVAKAIGRADVVIVDTWAQVTPGGNENAGEDMGKALSHCKGIRRATGAVVLLVHHSGKDASKGARGWSGLRAAADAELEVLRTPTGRLLRTAKQKDGADDLEWGFDLDTVEIGRDEDDDPITSCVVVDAQVPSARVLRKLGAKEEIVNSVIQEFAQAQTKGIEVGAVIAEAVRRMDPPVDGKRDTRKQHARRALETLSTGEDAPYWLNPEDNTIEVM